ncbi:hypothetical protein GCM10009558_102640 [Virgisporangium aurantiacum]
MVDEPVDLEPVTVEPVDVEPVDVTPVDVEPAEVAKPADAPVAATKPALRKQDSVVEAPPELEDIDDEVDIDPVEADVEADEADEAELDEEDPELAAAAAEFWSDVKVAPVELALPKGVGYTLRAYRMSDELAAVEVDEREDEFAGFLDDEDEADSDLVAEEELVAALGLEAGPVTKTRTKSDRDDDLDYDDDADEDDDDDLDDEDEDDDDIDAEADDDDDEDDEDEDDEDEDEDDEPTASDDSDDDDADDDEDDDDVEVKPAAEEVPVFLGRRGKVFVFSTADQLVEYVKASDDHDLAQLDTWADLRERITADHIVPDPADKYELDLVVDNLRGGADSLDYTLLIQAGEITRDIAYATRLEAVITALGPGTPLDDLDEAVRKADSSGGIRGFFARRKLRKIVTQQTALGWRTIIGKISSVVDWRE